MGHYARDMPERPEWFDEALFPYPSHWRDVAGHTVHYVDVGSGPTLLMLHGNPTWSFLYRRLIAGLSDRFRCVALDYPGFGLSQAAPGYGFTAAEHSAVVAQFVADLALEQVTPIVQDWGGPVGVGAMLADPGRYRGLIVGNTWAWPATARFRPFSELMGNPLVGQVTSKRLNAFLRVLLPRGVRRRSLTSAEMAMYLGPFPTAESREPVRIFPHEILAARPFLERLEQGLPSIADLPSLLLWADKDFAFKAGERQSWQQILTNRTDYTLYGASHYWQDDAGEEAALVIRAWWETAFG